MKYSRENIICSKCKTIVKKLDFKFYNSELKCSYCNAILTKAILNCKTCQKEILSYTFCDVCKIDEPKVIRILRNGDLL